MDKIIAKAFCFPLSSLLAASLADDLGIQKSQQLIYTIDFCHPCSFFF